MEGVWSVVVACVKISPSVVARQIANRLCSDPEISDL